MELRHVRQYADDLWVCGRCGDCSLADKIEASGRDVYHPCAVKNILGFEAYSSRGRVMILDDLLNGELEVDQNIVDWAYTCTTCKNCQETCTATAEGIRVPEMMEALRRDLVENGFAIPKHVEIEESIVNNGNPYRESEDTRSLVFGDRKWPERADVVYFVGCTSAYREKEIARTTVEIFDRLGLNFTVIPNERCCGSVLLRLGRTQSFKSLAKHNIDAIVRTGARTLVTACAGCFRTWKQDFPAQGLKYPFRVLHVTEYLDELVKQGVVHFEAPSPIRVTYHDPCHLGRHAGVYEAPRRVIQSVSNVELVEMETNKRYAHCCGSGGGVKGTYGELADEIAADRVEEAERTGAQVLLTACPFCHRGLEDGAESRGSSLKIMDLPTFLLPYLKAGPRPRTQEENLLKREFMDYLAAHPKIFEGLKKDAVIDYDIRGDRFHVHVTDRDRIEVISHRAENPDVELFFTPGAVKRLVSTQGEDEYAREFGRLFKEGTEAERILFNLRLNIVKLLMKGYRRFAQKAGLI
ncbi:MAG: (Fe-S)-binding protein [Candidatus Thorarchaeota archaeon]